MSGCTTSSLFLHLMLVKDTTVDTHGPPELSFLSHPRTSVAGGGSKWRGGKRKRKERKPELPLAPSECRGFSGWMLSLSPSFSPRAAPTRLTREQWHVTCVPRSAAPVATLRRVSVFCTVIFVWLLLLFSKEEEKKGKKCPWCFSLLPYFLLPGPLAFPTMPPPDYREFLGWFRSQFMVSFSCRKGPFTEVCLVISKCFCILPDTWKFCFVAFFLYSSCFFAYFVDVKFYIYVCYNAHTSH